MNLQPLSSYKSGESRQATLPRFYLLANNKPHLLKYNEKH